MTQQDGLPCLCGKGTRATCGCVRREAGPCERKVPGAERRGAEAESCTPRLERERGQLGGPDLQAAPRLCPHAALVPAGAGGQGGLLSLSVVRNKSGGASRRPSRWVVWLQVTADPDADIRGSLYNLQLQVEAQHLNLSKSILRGNGKAALDRVVRLASCDLCYNPHRYSTWDILARALLPFQALLGSERTPSRWRPPRCAAESYRKAHLSLLDELCYEASPSEEALQLGQDLRQRALRSTLIARQLVPLGEEQEVSYWEEELGLFLLQEVRDLPPQAGRLPAGDGEQRRWNCREAAQVSQPRGELAGLRLPSPLTYARVRRRPSRGPPPSCPRSGSSSTSSVKPWRSRAPQQWSTCQSTLARAATRLP